MVEELDDLIPQRLLVCAIIALAVRDCRNPASRTEALRWLESREVEEWCEGWEVDLQRIRQVVTKTNPDNLQ